MIMNELELILISGVTRKVGWLSSALTIFKKVRVGDAVFMFHRERIRNATMYLSSQISF